MADPLVPAPPTDPMIGMVIGSFVITRLLGQGGMGAVYLAQHKGAPHIRSVFKTMLAHLSRNALMISRFNTETEAVGRLAHENIVELKDFGVLPNGQMYLQFEFIDGTPLDRFVASHHGRLSLHRAAYLAFQVCDALDHAHAAGIVHRDLKPDNLLVVVQDQQRVPRFVKIVDFGISKVVHTCVVQTLSGMSMGTPYYMSVEQYANASEATAKSDVFSLAIVLWQMMTGELPWGTPDPTVLYHLQRTVIPTPPPEHVMPAAVAKILLRCLSEDPEYRPTMQELAVSLAAVIPGTTDAPSGTAILMHIAPRFLASSPDIDSVRAMSHAVAASPDGVAAMLWPRSKVAAGRASQPDGPLPPRNVPTGSGQPAGPERVRTPGELPSAPLQAQEPRPSASVMNVTAHEAPRAALARAGSGPNAAVSSPEAVTALPAESRRGSAAPAALGHAGAATHVHGLPAPVLAQFPTGLISQKHIAQEAPADGRAALSRLPSVVTASEIELAQGTPPGPQPYAHRDVPRVVVSHTQLTAPTPSPAVRQPEPPPYVRLPGAARSRSRTLVAIGVPAVALAAVAGFVLVRPRPHVAAQSARDATDPARARATAPARPEALPPGPAGAAPAVGPPSPARVLAPSPSVATDAGPHAVPATKEADPMHAGTNPRPESLAPLPATTAQTAADTGASRSAAVDTGASRSAAGPAIEPRSPDASRAGLVRQPATQKPLRARQTEARESGAKTGSLHLFVTPWAVCWVDGERIDQTPCLLDGLPVGRYRVRLENTVAHKNETLTATITAGATTTIERTW